MSRVPGPRPKPPRDFAESSPTWLRWEADAPRATTGSRMLRRSAASAGANNLRALPQVESTVPPRGSPLPDPGAADRALAGAGLSRCECAPRTFE